MTGSPGGLEDGIIVVKADEVTGNACVVVGPRHSETSRTGWRSLKVVAGTSFGTLRLTSGCGFDVFASTDSREDESAGTRGDEALKDDVTRCAFSFALSNSRLVREDFIEWNSPRAYRVVFLGRIAL